MSILLHGVAVLIGNCCARLGCYDFNFTFMARMEEICAIIAGRIDLKMREKYFRKKVLNNISFDI